MRIDGFLNKKPRQIAGASFPKRDLLGMEKQGNLTLPIRLMDSIHNLIFFTTSIFLIRRNPPLELSLNGLRNNTPLSCRHTLEDEMDAPTESVRCKSRRFLRWNAHADTRPEADKLTPFMGYQEIYRIYLWVRVTGITLLKAKASTLG